MVWYDSTGVGGGGEIEGVTVPRFNTAPRELVGARDRRLEESDWKAQVFSRLLDIVRSVSRWQSVSDISRDCDVSKTR